MAVASKYLRHEEGDAVLTEGSHAYWDKRYRECRVVGVPPEVFEWYVKDAEEVAAWMQASNPRLDRTARVLEMCCGNSELPQALGAHFGDILAVDWSSAVIEEMR